MGQQVSVDDAAVRPRRFGAQPVRDEFECRGYEGPKRWWTRGRKLVLRGHLVPKDRPFAERLRPGDVPDGPFAQCSSFPAGDVEDEGRRPLSCVVGEARQVHAHWPPPGTFTFSRSTRKIVAREASPKVNTVELASVRMGSLLAPARKNPFGFPWRGRVKLLTCFDLKWCARRDSNAGPSDPEKVV